MKTIFRLLCGLMAIALTTACSHEELLQTEPVQKPAEGKMVSVKAYTPSEQPASRLAFDDQGTEGLKLSWSEGDDFTSIVSNYKVTFTYDANTKEFSGNLPEDAILTDGVKAYYPSYIIEYIKNLSQQTGALNSATTYMEGEYDEAAQAFRFNHSTAILKVAFSGLPDGAEIESAVVSGDVDINITSSEGINKEAVYINLPAIAKDTKLKFDVRTTDGRLYTATKTVAAEEGIKVGVYYNTTVALQEACLLPAGDDFKNAIKAIQGYENATSLVFKANVAGDTPATRSGSNYTISLDDNVLTVSTPLSEFVFNADCSFMFANLPAITAINFNNCVNTAKVNNMSNMFYNCSNLASLDLSSFNTANVTNMNNMFYYCQNLTSLDLSSFNTANVTNMGYMFYYCSNLASLDLSSFNTENVGGMEYMFFTCSNLTSLNLSSFNTANVTDMSNMFEGCSKLTSLDLSSFNTAKVTLMTSMFNSCSSLTSLDLSSFNTSNVMDMKIMFSDCSNLASLNVGSFDTAKVEDMSYMFAYCQKLTSLDLTNFDFSKVQYFKSMFSDLGREAEKQPIPVYVTQAGYDILKDKNTDIVDNTQYAVPGHLPTGSDFNAAVNSFLESNSSLTKIKFIVNSSNTNRDNRIGTSEPYMVVGSDNETLEIHTAAAEFIFNKDCSDMFDGLSTITAIDFNDCINTEEVTNMGSIFYGCSALTSLDLSKFNTSNVTNMGSMFNSCSSLTSLDLSKFITSNVTNMGSMFYQCSSLESLNLSSFNTSKVEGMNFMFYDCKKLSSLNVSNFNTANVILMASMFKSCFALTSLNLSSFNTSAVTNMSEMFSNCYSLTSLDLSSFDFSQVQDYEYMFDYLGSSVTNQPIPIYVTQAGYEILNGKNTYHTYCYFQYVIK